MAKTGVEIAIELADLGAKMVESRFRRENPGASEQEVLDHVTAWWRHRPGAEHGDVAGNIRVVPPDEYP